MSLFNYQEIPTSPYPELPDVLQTYANELQTELGENLLGIYLVGSLASGDFEIGSSITIGQEPEQETTQIVSQVESLGKWPELNEELVLVKTTTDPNSDVLSWSYYHESVGLVLELLPQEFPHDAEPNQIDPNDNGWQLTEAALLDDIILKFMADDNRQSPADSFQAAGRCDAEVDDFAWPQFSEPRYAVRLCKEAGTGDSTEDRPSHGHHAVEAAEPGSLMSPLHHGLEAPVDPRGEDHRG